jgi:pimeloyl-ACP methyl ester carboxylesterase
MKKTVFRLLFIFLSFVSGFMLLSFLMAPPLLNYAEQERHKEGKTFWEWRSPHGPLYIHYEEKGSGDEHVILVHGFRLNTYTWRHLATPLADEGYHVWAIDLLGFGLSDKPNHIPYHPDFFLAQIEAFMLEKNIPSAHLIGNSLGGGLVLNFTVNIPDKVKSLVLIGALGYPLDLPYYLEISRHFSPLWAPFLGNFGVRESLKRVVYDPKNVSEEQVAAYALPYRFPGGMQSSLLTLQQFDKKRLVDLSQQYRLVEQPALIVWGLEDRLLPTDHFHQFTTDLKQNESLLIPECGHLPHEEKPEIVTEAVKNFLKKQSFKSITHLLFICSLCVW